MRAVAVVGSVLVHGTGFGLLALYIALSGLPDAPEAAAAALPPDPVAPSPSDPIEVVFLSPDEAPAAPTAPIDAPIDAPAGAAAPATAPRSHASTGAPHALVASTGAATGPSEPAPREGTAAGRGMFTMRGPTLVPPDELMQHLSEGGHAPPAPPHVSGLLHDTAGGGAVVDDLATVATVHRDGTVSFADKPDVDLEFHIPAIPTPSGIVRGVRDAGKAIGEWYLDPYAQTRYGKMQDLPRHLQATPDSCGSTNDTMCDDANAPDVEKKARATQRGQIGFGGTMDLTAYLMKKLHAGDPWAGRKRKLLAATFDERAAKGDAYHGDQLAHSAEIMRGNLEQLWRATPDAAARREALFEMWDECAEGEGPSGEAGTRARAMVIGWIGAHLPAGSPDAYSADELAKLSARRTSTAAFAPYP